MSQTLTDADTPADLVTVPVAPPRDPEQYRATTHFQQNLRERVPELDQAELPRRIIEDGTATRQLSLDALDLSVGGAPVAFTERVDGDPWTMVVALRPEAFGDADRLHRALTIYQGTPSHEGRGGDT